MLEVSKRVKTGKVYRFLCTESSTDETIM